MHLTKDGRSRDVRLTMTVLRDAAGQPNAIVSTERHVTDLKEGLPAGAVLREDGRLTMNRAAEAITGYQRAELPTVDAWCAALHGDRAQERRAHYETGHSVEHAVQALAIRRKDGPVRHVELTACDLGNAGGATRARLLCRPRRRDSARVIARLLRSLGSH